MIVKSVTFIGLHCIFLYILMFVYFIVQVFSIVVFGCIATARANNGYCPYNYYDYYNTSHACNFGIATGVISFIGLMVFLVMDALIDNMSNVLHRKYVVFADAAFSCKITLCT